MRQPPLFKTLIVATTAKDHAGMIAAAQPFFQKLAEENNFAADFTRDADAIHDENLAGYQAFVMLHIAPFEMTALQQVALQRFIESGKGWVGIHAAGLTGRNFVRAGRTYWQWYEDFLGGVVYSPHPAYQKGTVVVEDRTHPATKNLPPRFEIWDEWYEFNSSPRERVRVLAAADESTYTPNRPMGDHPIIWTNEQYGRAIYIGIGHDAAAIENKSFRILLRDALLWAGSAEQAAKG